MNPVSAHWVCRFPPRPLRFRVALVVFPDPPSPSTIVDGSSSRTLSFLSRVSRASPARLHSRAPSLGFRSPSRHQSVESTSAGLPQPAKFRPRRFSRPRRLTPPPTFVGLFHPTTTSGIRSPGVFPLAQPYGLVTRRGPLAGCPALPAGVATSARMTGPAFRAFLRARIRCDPRLFKP